MDIRVLQLNTKSLTIQADMDPKKKLAVLHTKPLVNKACRTMVWHIREGEEETKQEPTMEELDRTQDCWSLKALKLLRKHLKKSAVVMILMIPIARR